VEAVGEILKATLTTAEVTTGCCDDCGGELKFPEWGGRGWCPSCLNAEQEKAEAKEREAAAMRRSQFERDELARRLAAEVEGIPAKYRAASFASCDAGNPAVAAVMAWAKEPRGMVLIYGKCGRGKTYLAAAAKKYFNLQNAKSGFYCEDEILITIKSTFGAAAKMTEGEAYDLFTAPPPLIIDDMGTTRSTDFNFDVWETIIGRRYREDRPTLITTNYAPEQLGGRIGVRALERIRENKTMLEYAGENRRAM
jgi:DNA replication protein DnaC